MNFELNQILWEFTLNCNKMCKYCGSRNILNKEEKSKYTKEQIAKYITKVKPKTVTITGGEPSCELEELRKCVNILSDAGIIVKILTNGNLFDKVTDVNDVLYSKVKQYGLSINTIEDVDYANEHNYLKWKDKTTCITNFGTHNIDNFNEIWKFARRCSLWQVQLTMGNEFQLDINQIYNLNKRIDLLNDRYSKVSISMKELPEIEDSEFKEWAEKFTERIIKADNFNCNECMAGKTVFSITYNGYIIPCLSYRSWKSDLNIQGEVKDIVDIWENGFKFNRTRNFIPCCKTITGVLNLPTEKQFKELLIDQILKQGDKPQPMPDIISVYGVAIPNQVTVYGCASPMMKNIEQDSINNFTTTDSSSSLTNEEKENKNS